MSGNQKCSFVFMVVPFERLLCSVGLQERGLFGDALCVVWRAGRCYGPWPRAAVLLPEKAEIFS